MLGPWPWGLFLAIFAGIRPIFAAFRIENAPRGGSIPCYHLFCLFVPVWFRFPKCARPDVANNRAA